MHTIVWEQWYSLGLRHLPERSLPTKYRFQLLMPVQTEALL